MGNKACKERENLRKICSDAEEDINKLADQNES